MSTEPQSLTQSAATPASAPAASAAAKPASRAALGRSRVLVRGESIVASVGLAGGLLLAGVLGASAWWTLHTYRKSVEEGRRQQVSSIASVLAPAAETMLSTGELSALRRLVSDTARSAGLETCRIVLPGNQLLADADPKLPSLLKSLPKEWPADPKGAMLADAVPKANAATISVALTIPDRGAARLDLSAPLNLPQWSDTEYQVGVGAIAVGGMAALLFAYHGLRRRVRGLGAIRDALAAASRGESAASALKVSADYGAEATCWNQMLSELETLRSEALLRSAEERASGGSVRDAELGSACDAMWQGLLLIDDKMSIKYANGAAAVFLRARRDELANADLRKYIKDATVDAALEAAATGKNRQRATVESVREGESGARSVLRFGVRPVRKDDAGAAVVLIDDVTQQKVADESRNAFVAQATHELRTPLTNIRLYVETMVESGADDAATRGKCLNVISTEVRRLERIVSDMLSVSEIEAGSLKIHTDDVRLDALFEELENDYRPQATDKEIALTFELPPKLPVVQADRDKFSLAVHNLIGNALKYTPTGGKVTVRVAEVNGNLTIAVIDNGIGIKIEECELIFERFYRAKDKRIANITGSGIGLALARDVARLHGGEITVKSEIDKGSTFTLVLPMNGTSVMRKAA